MLITIGKFQDGQPAIFNGPTTKPVQANDLILDGATVWRLVWNHNGLRLRGVDVTEKIRPAMDTAGWNLVHLLDNDGNETGQRWVHESNARELCGFVWFASNGKVTLAV
jgi:hypothetical protein